MITCQFHFAVTARNRQPDSTVAGNLRRVLTQFSRPDGQDPPWVKLLAHSPSHTSPGAAPPELSRQLEQDTEMLRICASILFASIVAYPAWSSTIPTMQGPRTLTLDVFLDERPIGLQRFDLQPTTTGLRIVSAADFEVRILGFKAFGYTHRNQEEWRNGCLEKIRSSTDSNGRRSQVDGGLEGGTFTVVAAGATAQTTDCVGSFAYWDKSQLVSRAKLLNPQTGEYMPVKVTRQGEGVLRIDERDLPVESYVLTGKGIDIALHYSLVDGDWLGLDSRVENGRILRYRRVPDELPGSAIALGAL